MQTRSLFDALVPEFVYQPRNPSVAPAAGISLYWIPCFYCLALYPTTWGKCIKVRNIISPGWGRSPCDLTVARPPTVCDNMMRKLMRWGQNEKDLTSQVYELNTWDGQGTQIICKGLSVSSLLFSDDERQLTNISLGNFVYTFSEMYAMRHRDRVTNSNTSKV